MYRIGRTYSEYTDGVPYIDSPSGNRIWLHPDGDDGQVAAFVDELNQKEKERMHEELKRAAMQSIRTKIGLRRAIKTGVRLGRPRLSLSPDEVIKLQDLRDNGGYSFKKLATHFRICKSSAKRLYDRAKGSQ